MRLPSLPGFSIPYPTLTLRSPRRRRPPSDYSVLHATGMVLLGVLAVLAIAVAAVWEFLQGFMQGFRDARAPIPPDLDIQGPYPGKSVPRQYEVVCNQDSEVLLNGIPIGHIDSGPWQFCSYTDPPAPARPSKARAFDDACDYAEGIARQA